MDAANCISCGMAMKAASDHAQSDPALDYCVFCARPDGSMQSYEEKLDSLTLFLLQKEGLDLDEAMAKARREMANLPAWKGLTP